MTTKTLPLAALLALTVLPVSPLRADEHDDFLKGQWSVQLYGGYMDELGPYDQEIAFGTVGAAYYIVDDLSLGVEFSAWDVNQPGDDAFAGMAAFMIRHHAVQFEGGSFFLDVGESVFEADNPVPEEGTTFNFVFQFGGGFTFELAAHAHLMTGVRYFHLSNADREGDARNPAMNGVQGFVGVMFTF